MVGSPRYTRQVALVSGRPRRPELRSSEE